MWRKGFTFKVQTPHLKFGSWNDSRVSTVFLVWIKPNILWIRLRPALKRSTWLRSLLCVLFCVWSVCYAVSGVKINDKTSLQTLFIFLFFTIWPPINTEKRTVSPRTNWPISVPSCREGRSSLTCLVWFSIWFGIFKVCYFWLFVCLFSLPRQSVSLSNKNLEAKFSQYFFQPPDKNL